MMSRQAEIVVELRVIRDRMAAHVVAMDDLYAARLRLWQEGQELDPKMTHAVLAEPSNVTEGAVTQALRRVRLRVPARR